MSAGHPRLLLTNDDGIESPGIRVLAGRLAPDFDLVVAAPDIDYSGSGTGIGRIDTVEGVGLAEADLPGIVAFTVSGPPGLAVTAAALGAFGAPPDLVVSGINAGMNTGRSILHSGTVGAVLTARTFKSRGLAVSLAASEPWHWETAAEIARSVIDWLLTREGIAINLNVPALPLDRVEGIHWAELDDFGHFRVATAAPRGERLQFEVRSGSSGLDPASDTALVTRGYATATPIQILQRSEFPETPAEELWPGRPGSPRRVLLAESRGNHDERAQGGARQRSR